MGWCSFWAENLDDGQSGTSRSAPGSLASLLSITRVLGVWCWLRAVP